MAAASEQNKNGLKPNKAGEPNFKLPFEPKGPIVFKREGKHVYAKKVLENNTDKKVVFKVKVTNKELFRVSKAVDVLAAGAKVNIRIYFSGTPAEAASYFVAFYHADIPEAAAAKKASEIWKEVQPAGVMRIACACEVEEAKEKKEGKKEEEKKIEKKEEGKKEKEEKEVKKEEEKEEKKEEEKKEEKKVEEKGEVKKEEEKEEKKEEEKEEKKEEEKKEEKKEEEKEEKKVEEKKESEPAMEKQEEKKDAADGEKKEDAVKGGEKEEKKEDEAGAANPEKEDEKKEDS